MRWKYFRRKLKFNFNKNVYVGRFRIFKKTSTFKIQRDINFFVIYRWVICVKYDGKFYMRRKQRTIKIRLDTDAFLKCIFDLLLKIVFIMG